MGQQRNRRPNSWYTAPTGQKRCGTCEEFKPLEQFYTDTTNVKDGKQGRCSQCSRSAAAKYIEGKGGNRNHNLYRKYGITEVAYEVYFKLQNGLCAICMKSAENELHGVFSVDHNHDTGKIRGLLCRSCNLGLGKFSDDPTVLQKAIDYLDRNGS